MGGYFHIDHASETCVTANLNLRTEWQKVRKMMRFLRIVL